MTHPVSNMGTVTDTTTPDPVVDDAPAPAADAVDDATTPTDDAPAKLELTQAEIDAMIEKRLSRERKRLAEEHQQQVERAKMDEADRLKAEKADAEQAAVAAQTAADQRVVRAEAKLTALDQGVDPKRIEAFLRIVDLSAVEVADGDPDAKALAKAIEDALSTVPEFKAQTAPARGSGGGFNKDADDARATSLDAAVQKRLAAAS